MTQKDKNLLINLRMNGILRFNKNLAIDLGIYEN